MGPRRRWIVVGVAVVVLCLAVGLSFLALFRDPTADRFMVGVELVEGGEVVVHVGDCMGGALERVSVDVASVDGGQPPPGDELWLVEIGEGVDGVLLERGHVYEMRIGTPPVGMVETVRLLEPLPQDERLVVAASTSRQGFGFFFEIDDLEEGSLFAYRDLKSRERFSRDLDRLCAGHNSIWDDLWYRLFG